MMEVKVIFEGKLDPKDLEEIRKELYGIQTFAIKDCFFETYGAGMMESSFANRISLLPIIQEEDMKDREGCISGEGPGYLTTNEALGMRFAGDFPICYLKEGEIIRCKFNLELGNAIEHEKFAAVSRVRYEFLDDGDGNIIETAIYFVNNGCYDVKTIIENLMGEDDEDYF